jgi:hypothetical protein
VAGRPLRVAAFALLLTANYGLAQAAGKSEPAKSIDATLAAKTSDLPPTAPKETKIFPLAEVHRGQRGVAYTVFEGVVPEPMEVEILGLLKNALGPGQDMILARLHGTKPEFTGVVAGMSGSPVYIDGRLVGALSYRIGQFSKEPIAGITPIERMLELRDGDHSNSPTPKAITNQASYDLPGSLTSGAEITAMETPLVFGGFSQEAVDRFGDRFRAMGLTPVAGLGGADPAAKQPEPLVPGSAVSAILVRGDLSMAGTCTVTYLDATHLLACGHPISQFGAVSMPMTKAEVVATLPSPLNAFKIINTTETVGAFTEDRASAIMGRFGEEARMIPVSVEVKAPAGSEASKTRTVHFEVLDNRELTPSALIVSVYQSLQQTNSAMADVSYTLSGELTVRGLPSVLFNGIMAPSESAPAAINTALYINDRFGRLYANEIEQPIVTGLHLHLEAIPERRTAVLEQARMSRMEVKPGDTVEVEATIRPYHSGNSSPASGSSVGAEPGSHILRIPVTIPVGTTPGELRLVVSDSGTVDRLTLGAPASAAGSQHILGLRDMIDQMNSMHANDRVYVTLLDHKPQAAIEGGTFGSVPLSMANVLEPLKAEQRLQLTGETAEQLGSTATGYALTGFQLVMLQVR